MPPVLKPRPDDLPSDAPWPLPAGIVWNPFPDQRPRYQVYSRATGVKRYVDTASTFGAALALQIAAAAEAEVNRREGIEEGGIGRRRTLRDACEAYLASRRLDPEFSSGDAYEHRLVTHVYDETDERKHKMGDRFISQITRAHLMAWREKLKAKLAKGRGGARLSPATINGVHKTLKAAFGWFHEMRWIETDPMAGMSTLDEPERDKTIVEDRGQVEGFLAVCHEVACADLPDIVAVLLGTGMRISEVLLLRWSRVFLDHEFKGRSLPYLQTEGKGNKVRAVPILDVILPVLQRRHAERTGDLVFPGSPLRRKKEGARKRVSQRERRAMLAPGEHARDSRAVLRMYRKAIAIYNSRHPDSPIDERIRLHDTRHTFATRWVEEGGDLFQLSKILGHHDVKLTVDTYARLSVRGFADELGRMSFQIPDPLPKQLPAATGGK